jgi:16S rRNA (uracil1498-N3)-methyltransferase
MHRFFVPPDTISGGEVRLGGDLAHQIVRVLRLHRGEKVVLLNAKREEYDVELLEVGAEQVTARVLTRRAASREPIVNLTLAQGLLKADHFEEVVEAATQLGVAAVQPFVSERCVVREVSSQKAQRFARVAQEAAETSKRTVIPEIAEVVAWADLCRASDDAHGFVVPWEGERSRQLHEALHEIRIAHASRESPRVVVAIGPEGGLTHEEVLLAGEHGAHVVTLGPRVLRTETAAAVLAALVLYELGDLSSGPA